MSVGTTTSTPFSASRRGNCERGSTPLVRPVNASGVQSASPRTITRARVRLSRIEQKSFPRHARKHIPTNGMDGYSCPGQLRAGTRRRHQFEPRGRRRGVHHSQDGSQMLSIGPMLASYAWRISVPIFRTAVGRILEAAGRSDRSRRPLLHPMAASNPSFTVPGRNSGDSAARERPTSGRPMPGQGENRHTADRHQ